MPETSETSRGERTRQAVLDAAEAAFRAHGFQGATTAAIARDAGVSEGSVFAHFGSKSGLLLALMERTYNRAFARLDDDARGATDPADRLRRLTRGWLVAVVEDWSLVRVFSQHGRFSDDADVRAAYHGLSRDLTRRFVAALSDLSDTHGLRDGLPLSLLRDLIFGAGEHVALRWSGDRAELCDTADRLVDVVLYGALVRSSGDVTLEALDAKLDRLLEATR